MQTQSTQEIRATERLNRDVILQNADTYLAPRTDAEKQIALIWQEFFSLDKIGVQDDFYDLGGHSLTALHLLNQINQKFKSAINVANFLSQATTIEQLAKLIDKSNPKSISTASVLIPLRIQGKQPPLFCLHPVSGTAVCYVELAKYLRYNGPIYGIQDPSLEHKKSLFSSLEDMASAYIVEIKNIQPMGPYILGGLSFGATLAVEVARQLRLAGDTIAALFFFDGWAKFSTAQHIEERFQMGIKQLYKKNPNTQNFYHLAWERMQLLLNYTIQPIKEPVFLYKAQTLLPEYIEIDDPHNYWKKHVNNTIEVHIVPGDHETILSQPNIQILAKLVDKMLLKMNHHIKTFALSES